MGGGLIQLVATGIPDLYLTGDPQITWFKVLYRRYTEFGMQDHPLRLDGDIQFGTTHMIKIPPIADKLGRVSFVVDVPTPELKMKDPTVQTIQEIVDDYVGPLVFSPPKKPTDKVTYDDLFNDSEDSLGSKLVTKAKDLDKMYDARTDVLEYVRNTYDVYAGERIGRFIAVKAFQIDFSRFGENVDPEGYLVLNYRRTKELIESDYKIITLDEDSFIYRLDDKDDELSLVNNRTDRDIIYSTPTRTRQPKSTLYTRASLAKVYPRSIPKADYREIANIEDLTPTNFDLKNKRYHLIISVKLLREVKKRSLYLRDIYVDNELGDVNAYEEEESIRDSDLNADRERKTLFTNFDVNKMLSDGEFETGVFEFKFDDKFDSEEDYSNKVEDAINEIRLTTAISSIDQTKGRVDNSGSSDVGDIDVDGDGFDERFNRFDVNENAIYDPTWEFDTILDLNTVDDVGVPTPGYWLVDISTFDTHDDTTMNSQDVLQLVSDNVLINPKYIYSIPDRVGFAPFIIKRVWEPSIVRKTYTSDDENIVVKSEKVPNMLDGVSTLTKIFRDFYTIPSVIDTTNNINFVGLIDNGVKVTDIANLHNLLLTIYEDAADIDNETRNYKIEDIKLYNAVTIRELMYKKLIKDIIYVDQRKLSSDIVETLAKYYRRIVSRIDDGVVLEDKYEENINYSNQDDTSDPMVFNRDVVYENTKFLMWSYYYEHIYLKYNISIDNFKDVADDMNYLSYMLLHLALDPSNLDPSQDTGVAQLDPTTESVRFATNKLSTIPDVVLYDDNFIENINSAHRSTTHNDGDIFESHYIYAGDRFDSTETTPYEARFLENDIKYTYPSGYRTCVNREVEFYHVVEALNHTDADLNELVYDHFIRLIANAYDDPRNYIYTLSFRTVENFLRTYYRDVNILNSSISLEKLTTELLSQIVRGFNTTLLSYIKIVFSVWKNSTYFDRELTPVILSYLEEMNGTGVRTKTTIDYDAHYVVNELARLKTLDENIGGITEKEFDLGDPLKLRAKHLAGTDVTMRPLMGYSYRYDINLSDPKSYREPTDYKINTQGFVDNIKTLTSTILTTNAQIQDAVSDQISTQAQNVKSTMENMFKYNVPVVTGMNYIFWRDLNVYMKIVFNDINEDVQIQLDDKIQYYNNTTVLNHLPVAITYSYGQYMQYIFNTYTTHDVFYNSNQTDTQSSAQKNDVVIGNVEFDMFPIEEEEDINRNFKYDHEPPPIENVFVRFLGTDVRLKPSCPFHSNIDDLPNLATYERLVDEYLISNDIDLVANNQDVDMCPICFRTIAFRALFKMVLARSVFSQTADNTLDTEFRVVDDEIIQGMIPNSGLSDSPLVKGDAENDFNSISSQYTLYLYRPEDVVYDQVSQSYFHSLIEFTIHRSATILFRYRNMVMNIVSKSQTEFDAWVSSHTPTSSQIGVPNPFDNKNELDRYKDYVDYLRVLRIDDNKVKFYQQMDRWISVLTYTESNQSSFSVIKNIYDSSTPKITDTTLDQSDYTEAISFIGRNDVLDADTVTFNLVPNVFYEKTAMDKSGVNIVRYQTYKGNIALWTLIQREMIKSYNTFFNKTVDPRELLLKIDIPLQNLINIIVTPKTTLKREELVQYISSRNTAADLYNEIYDILKFGTHDQFINKNGTIDFYRAKQTHEYLSLTNSPFLNEFKDRVSTNMINYCRQLIMYYNGLLVRYNKMKFLLNVQNIALNPDAFYFNFSQEISKAYLDTVRQTITDFKIVDVNQQKSSFISRDFYYNDTSRYYFIKTDTFRDSEKDINDLTLVNDYLKFDKNNNFHLSQCFTLNQLMSMMRLLGLHDETASVYDDYNNPDIQIQDATTLQYVDNIGKGIAVRFNDHFEKYVSIDTKTRNLNNYDLYTYESYVMYDDNDGYQFVPIMKKQTDRGLYNRVWYYLPTISNILYDQYYTPVSIVSIPNFNQTPTYFETETVVSRTYTQCLTSSPLIYMKNKLSHSPLNVHNHSKHLKKWERQFHNDSVANDDTSALFDQNILLRNTVQGDVEDMKQKELDAWSGLFNAYTYFAGVYGYTNTLIIITQIENDYQDASNSFSNILSECRNLFDSLVEKALPAFSLSSPLMKGEHLSLVLTIEYAKIFNQLRTTIQKHIDFIDALNKRLINLRDATIAEIRRKVPIVNDTTFKPLYEAFSNMNKTLVAGAKKLSEINLATPITSLTNIGLQNINKETFVEIMYLKINEVASYEPIFRTEFFNELGIIDRLFSELNGIFASTNVDTRKYTPSVLFNSPNLKLLNDYSRYRDALYFILLDIIRLITPKDVSIQTFLTYTIGGENLNILPDLDISSQNLDNLFITSIDNESRVNTFDTVIQNIKLAINAVLYPMERIAYLPRYIDISRQPVDEFKRYDLDRVILETGDVQNALHPVDENYYERKQRIINLKQKDPKGLAEIKTRGVRKARELATRRSLKFSRSRGDQDTDTSDNSPKTIINTYVGSDVYNQIVRILSNKIPKHAWVRYLGYRMIEEISLVIDGEQIDLQDGDLMLLLHKMFDPIEHERGINQMLGHIPEMYEVSSLPKPAMRLYVQFFLFFCRDYGNSLPLVNMLYSDIQLRLKLRSIDELLYIERGGELKKPIKMKAQILGNFIYLGDEERRVCATSKIESIMDRFVSSGTYVRGFNDLKGSMLTDFGTATNVLKLRYTFDDPCKYFLWKIQIGYPDAHDTDKIHWDLSNYRVRRTTTNTGLSKNVLEDVDVGIIDTKSKIIETVNRVLIEFNGKTREQWKDRTYYQLVQPYNKCVNSLDSGESLYAMCLFPKMLQPTGGTNMSMLDNVSFYMEINNEIANLMKNTNLKLKITMWECSYNIFVAMSGFSALRFYGTK